MKIANSPTEEVTQVFGQKSLKNLQLNLVSTCVTCDEGPSPVAEKFTYNQR